MNVDVAQVGGSRPVCGRMSSASMCARYTELAQRIDLFLIRRQARSQYVVGSADALRGCHTVTIGSQTCSCRCVDPPCHHLLFVMVRVLGAAVYTDRCPPLQLPTLSSADVTMLLNGSSQRTSGPVSTRSQSLTSSQERLCTVRRRSSGVCCVCFRSLTTVLSPISAHPRHDQQLYSCRRAGCRQQLHERCMRIWQEHCSELRSRAPPLSATLSLDTTSVPCPHCIGTPSSPSLPTHARRRTTRSALSATSPRSPFSASPARRTHILGRGLTQQLVSEDWRTRDAGLLQLQTDISAALYSNSSGSSSISVDYMCAVIDVLTTLCADPIHKVFVGVINCLRVTMRAFTEVYRAGVEVNTALSSDCDRLRHSLSPLIDALLLRAADSHTRSARLSVSALVRLAGVADVVVVVLERVLVEGRSGCDTRQWRAGRLAAIEQLIQQLPHVFAHCCRRCPPERVGVQCWRLRRLAGWAARMVVDTQQHQQQGGVSAAVTARWRHLLVLLTASLWRMSADGRCDAMAVLSSLEHSLAVKLRRSVEAAATGDVDAVCSHCELANSDASSGNAGSCQLLCTSGDGGVRPNQLAVYAANTTDNSEVTDLVKSAEISALTHASLQKRKRRQTRVSGLQHTAGHHESGDTHRHHPEQPVTQLRQDRQSLSGQYPLLSSPESSLSPSDSPALKKLHKHTQEAHSYSHLAGGRATVNHRSDDDDDDNDEDSGMYESRTNSAASNRLDSNSDDKAPIDEVVIFPEAQNVVSNGHFYYTEGVHWMRGARLGSGSFSVCHQAWDCRSGLLMAVKQLPTLSSAEQLRAVDELQLLARLRHRRLLQLLAATRRPDRLCLFVEWEAGGSVQSLLERFGSLSTDVIRRYGLHLLQGLAYLHENRVVHRDLKGANLLVDSSGQWLKIADLGSAAVLTGDSTLPGELAGQLLGTVAFMAPEVVRGGHYGRSSDVWSAGCCVIEMATGRPPWHQWACANFMTLLFKIADSQKPPALPSDLADDLRELVIDCHKMDQRQRPRARDLLHYPCFKAVTHD